MNDKDGEKMVIWHGLKKDRVSPERFIAVIEISKGSKKKYELDKETGMIILDRVLFTSTHYPANYGFIPLTYAGDNDPLDVLVLCQEDIEPLCLVECVPIGLIVMKDQDEVDEKIICRPTKDPTYADINDISQLSRHLVIEMEHFFKVYKQLEDKTTSNFSILGRDEAAKTIEKAIKRYKEVFGN
jgi:inorganic pyrophosphatase